MDDGFEVWNQHNSFAESQICQYCREGNENEKHRNHQISNMSNDHEQKHTTMQIPMICRISTNSRKAKRFQAVNTKPLNVFPA
jgi:hypothetical protein